METEKDYCGFNSLDELKAAYLALLSEHEAVLSKVAEADETNGDATLPDENVPVYERGDWNQRVQDFLQRVPIAKEYGKRIAGVLVADEGLTKLPNALEIALINILLEERQNAGDSLESAKELALNTPEIREAIIAEYLASFAKRPPASITGGGSTVVTPPRSPKSIREATKLVKQLFK